MAGKAGHLPRAGRLLAATAAVFALAATPAEARDWRFFRPGFEKLIALHCRAKWVVHPEQVPPCIAEQRAAMWVWTASMAQGGVEPELSFVLVNCRSRWSAVPHTNWVQTIACTRNYFGAVR